MSARDIIVQEDLQDAVTITNSETQVVNIMFNQNSYKHSKTDGIISLSVYPEITSGSSMTLEINAYPLDKDGNLPRNSADFKKVLRAAATFTSSAEGTDPPYMYEITDMVKCFGIQIELIQAGTGVTSAKVGLNY